MARPTKRGIEYFALDVDFFADDKIRLIRGEFKQKGVLCVLYLLCEVYRTEGYYYIFDDMRATLLAEKIGAEVSPAFVREVVGGCCRCGFFDKAVFNASNALTSRGIQRRYIRAVSARPQITVDETYWLLDLEDPDDVPEWVRPKIRLRQVSQKIDLQNNGVSEQTNPEKKQKSTQRKVKESKAQERKADPFPAFAGGDVALLAALQDFERSRAELKKPMTEIAKSRLCAKLAALADEAGVRDRSGYLCAALAESMVRGWSGVFAPKDFMDKAAPMPAPKTEQGGPVVVTEDSDLAALL